MNGFEVYTYFGRVVARFDIGPGETYHKALDKARAELIARGDKGFWIRQY